MAFLLTSITQTLRRALCFLINLFKELEQVIQDGSSGRELIERGFLQDVQLATQLNSSQTFPKL